MSDEAGEGQLSELSSDKGRDPQVARYVTGSEERGHEGPPEKESRVSNAVLTREHKGFVLLLPLPNTDRSAPLFDGRTGEPVYFQRQDILMVQNQMHCELSQVAGFLGIKHIEVRG